MKPRAHPGNEIKVDTKRTNLVLRFLQLGAVQPDVEPAEAERVTRTSPSATRMLDRVATPRIAICFYFK